MSIHLLREVERIKKHLLALSAMVEEALRKAAKAVTHKDETLARRVIEDDSEIDHMEVDIEEDCLKILALHQPVAVDLRFIVAILKINSDLERIGDLAVNIAEQVLFLSAQPMPMPANGYDFTAMASKAQVMLKQSLDSLIQLDTTLARNVCTADDEVDQQYRAIFMTAKEQIKIHPDQTDVWLIILMIARQLERIADHTTNIAEDVIYMIDGHIVRHQHEQTG